jgi:hypothetical protein
MITWVLLAFRRTLGANFCTVLADQVTEFTIALHETYRKTAEFSAIGIECYTARHAFRVLLFARSCALFTHIRTALASFYAGLVLLLGHEFLLKTLLFRQGL